MIRLLGKYKYGGQRQTIDRTLKEALSQEIKGKDPNIIDLPFNFIYQGKGRRVNY
jgi:hypothetical protein